MREYYRERYGVLTARKLHVARLIAEGRSDAQIAGTLGITWQCVRRHIEGITRIWRLDNSRNLRVQIALRVEREAEQSGDNTSSGAVVLDSQ